ncbi:MAG: hypothetical protein IT385_19170, partial [Deltaproteobacteria bacterium]|nr:hypothetical protein [Deltaproteobacteria bacterium]
MSPRLAFLFTLVVSAAPAHATPVSGEVRCGDCTAAAIRIEADDAGAPGATLGIVPAAPGPFTIDLPPAIGPVYLSAFRDEDEDLDVDPGTAAVRHPSAIDVAAGPVSGVVLDLGTLPSTAEVALAGAVTCGDCAGGVRVVLRADADGQPGPELARALLPVPGPFVFTLPADLGDVWLEATRVVPTGDAPVRQGPFTIGDVDTTGVELALPPRGPATVTVGGALACPTCPTPAPRLVARVTADGAL